MSANYQSKHGANNSTVYLNGSQVKANITHIKEDVYGNWEGVAIIKGVTLKVTKNKTLGGWVANKE